MDGFWRNLLCYCSVAEISLMLMPASSEFVALCQSQVRLLTQGLGATASVVYLTEELTEGSETNLIPVVAYPETTDLWQASQVELLFPEKNAAIKAVPKFLLPERSLPGVSAVSPPQVDATMPPSSDENRQETRKNSAHQVILPLMHKGVVRGLLVTGRQDRPWNQRERAQIEQVARSLAIARDLDRRAQWLEENYRQQLRIRNQQSDLLSDLLHQFRNPLTALRTFGKLLLKRLQPGDRNQVIAQSIIQESKHLQELLQQFDQTVSLEADDPALILPNSVYLPAVSDFNDNDSDLSSAVSSTSNASVLDTTAHSSIPKALLPSVEIANLHQQNLHFLGFPLSIESCSIAEILASLIVSAAAIAQEQGLQLHTMIPQDLPPLQANPRALREVLSNLIDNALKYTAKNGQIYIQVARHLLPQGNQQVIAISDTGPGIPSQDLERIFERHYRGIQAITDIPGTGLGLAIARDLLQQMQGDIQAFSPAQPLQAILESTVPSSSGLPSNETEGGQGTTFAIWLPEDAIYEGNGERGTGNGEWVKD